MLALGTIILAPLARKQMGDKKDRSKSRNAKTIDKAGSYELAKYNVAEGSFRPSILLGSFTPQLSVGNLRKLLIALKRRIFL